MQILIYIKMILNEIVKQFAHRCSSIIRNNEKYNPKIAYPIQSPGNVGNLREITMDSLEKYGVIIIEPQKIFEFYNNLHSYLASCSVDVVKVDVQNLIETLGSRVGGRGSLTRRYQEALEQSTARNFKDNNLICCMSHNLDSIYRFACSLNFIHINLKLPCWNVVSH